MCKGEILLSDGKIKNLKIKNWKFMLFEATFAIIFRNMPHFRLKKDPLKCLHEFHEDSVVLINTFLHENYHKWAEYMPKRIWKKVRIFILRKDDFAMCEKVSLAYARSFFSSPQFLLSSASEWSRAYSSLSSI